MKKTLAFCCLYILFVSIGFAQTASNFAIKAAEKSKKRDYKGAIEYYNKAIEIAPDSADYYIYKSYCYYNMGDKDAADINAQDILKTFDNNWYAYTIVADYYQDVKEFDKEVETMELAVEKFTSVHDTVRISLLNGLGWSRYNVRDFYGAKKEYMRASAIDTANVHTWYYLASVYDEVGKADSSIYYYNRLIEKNPDRWGYYISIGFLYNNIEKYTEAMGIYKKAFALVDKIKKNKGYIDDSSLGLLYSNRGFANFKLGKYKDALKDLNKGVEYYPMNSYVYKNRALVYIQLKMFKEACVDLYRATSLGFSDQYGTEVEKMITTYCR